MSQLRTQTSQPFVCSWETVRKGYNIQFNSKKKLFQLLLTNKLLWWIMKMVLSFFPLPYAKVISLTNVVTYPHCFLTAYKRLVFLHVLAGKSYLKKTRPILLVLDDHSKLHVSLQSKTNLLLVKIIQLLTFLKSFYFFHLFHQQKTFLKISDFHNLWNNIIIKKMCTASLLCEGIIKTLKRMPLWSVLDWLFDRLQVSVQFKSVFIVYPHIYMTYKGRTLW